LRLVVFSGGEATILKQDLYDAIAHCTGLGLLNRIVSNASSGKTPNTAARTAKALADAGLGELNISTGKDHQEWVSTQSVIQAAKAAVERGIFTMITVKTDDDANTRLFAIVAQLVSSGVVAPQACSAVAVCAAAVVVAIVAIAAAYVSVTVGATVALMAGVTVSVVVHLAVKASGGGGCNSCHQKALTSDDAPLQAPFTGTMAKLDPALIRNSERAMRLAKIMNSPGLQIQAIKDVIRAEISAFMKAMRNSGLLPVNDEHLALATEATTAYTYRVIGF